MLHINNELKIYIMKIFIKGTKTEVTQLINNISNNAKDLNNLICETLIIDELEYAIDSITKITNLDEDIISVELNTINN